MVTNSSPSCSGVRQTIKEQKWEILWVEIEKNLTNEKESCVEAKQNKKCTDYFSSTGRCLAMSSKADPHHKQQWLAKTNNMNTCVSPLQLLSLIFFFFSWAQYHITLLLFRSAVPLYCFHFLAYPRSIFRVSGQGQSEKKRRP